MVGDNAMPDRSPDVAKAADPGFEPCVVMVTCPDTDVAGAIAEACVSECLAACVNLLPGLTSVYRWEGAVHKDSEALLLLKTHRGLLEALKGRVVALHPYSVPEFVVLPIVAGSREYLGWMAELLRNP